MSVVCVYMGRADECQNCGGWTKAGGFDIDGNPDPSIEKGPFEGDPRFCSEDCYADHQEFVERERRWRATEYCHSCGFDRWEHAEGCERANG